MRTFLRKINRKYDAMESNKRFVTFLLVFVFPFSILLGVFFPVGMLYALVVGGARIWYVKFGER